MNRLTSVLFATASLVVSSTVVWSQANLSDYFGFEGLELVRIDRGAGPMLLSDLNGNGLNDLVVVNNFKSRIELHYQRANASPDDVRMPTRVNELPEHWRFRRETISVSHRVESIVAHDYDGDGLVDLIYLGQPSELVFVRQISPGRFEVDRRHRVRGLTGGAHALAVADVIGDAQPELICIAEGKIQIWNLQGNDISRAATLAAGTNMASFRLADFTGNGRLDIAGVIPEDAAPIRLWLSEEHDGQKVLGPQVRLEMPALRTFAPVRLPNRDAAMLGVVERASKRIVVYHLDEEPIPATGDRVADMRIHSFSDPDSRARDVVVADVTGNGLADVISTDTAANAVVVYAQQPGRGLRPGQSYPSLEEITHLAIGTGSTRDATTLYVLSERVGMIGRSIITNGMVGYPAPLTLTGGEAPVAMSFVHLDDGPAVAAVMRDGRNYTLTIIREGGPVETIPLGAASRSPDSIVALDADQSGRVDLLLLTRDRPMMMLQRTQEGFELRESRDMGQFGLVQAATSENTAVFDIDGDGRPELLVADRNFIRAVRFDPDPGEGISPGWQVVRQLNARDSTARLVSLTVFDDRIIAADRQNNRLIIFSPSELDPAGWTQTEAIDTQGFTFSEIHAGHFSGDGERNILAIGNHGFAVIQLAGTRITLHEEAAWRPDNERQLHHELIVGDVNGDGFTDLIALDAGEQLCEIFTFSEAGSMLHAMGFKVFESRIFTGGVSREFEPSTGLIGDITGNGANDLLLLAHDRILIYPQATQE